MEGIEPNPKWRASVCHDVLADLLSDADAVDVDRDVDACMDNNGMSVRLGSLVRSPRGSSRISTGDEDIRPSHEGFSTDCIRNLPGVATRQPTPSTHAVRM